MDTLNFRMAIGHLIEENRASNIISVPKNLKDPKGSRIQIQNSKFKDPGSKLKAQGSRFKDQGPRLRDPGSAHGFLNTKKV